MYASALCCVRDGCEYEWLPSSMSVREPELQQPGLLWLRDPRPVHQPYGPDVVLLQDGQQPPGDALALGGLRVE